MKGNTVSIKGNVTKDAEARRTQSGGNVLRFGIAWNQSKPDGNGGYKDVPHYFDVTCFPTDRQLAMIQPYIVKGARCAIIDGRLDYSTWEKDGQKRSAVQIVVEDPIAGLLVYKSMQTQSQPQNGPQQSYGQTQSYVQSANRSEQWVEGATNEPPVSVYDDDIPF